MSRAVLSLGSNLGDRLANLQLAVTGFSAVLRAASPVYETRPWGVLEQNDFLNAVLIVESVDVDEWEWLRRGQALEDVAHRVRTQRWGPRTLDVDVVTVERNGEAVRSADPDLLLPHPGAAERATVLVPWMDIDPTAELPGHGRVADVLAALGDQATEGMRRRDDLELTR